ncbi:unknown [Mycoplasma sp. CAG:956]|nr:unknown [Mycoplasma sp. CAG:956]
MEKISFYFKSILLFGLYIILVSFISSLFYLYTNMSYNVNAFILFIFTSIGFAILNFFNGKKAISKGYLAGLKLGGAILIFFFLVSLLADGCILFSRIIYYGIILLISIISASLGINFKGKTSLK